MNRERALTITWTLLRVVFGLMFVQVGGLKLFGWFGGMPGANGAPPPVLSQAWIGGVLEVVGGTFMVITMVGFQEARRVAGTGSRTLIAAMTSAFAAGQIAGPLVVSAAGGYFLPLAIAAALLAASALILWRSP